MNVQQQRVLCKNNHIKNHIKIPKMYFKREQSIGKKEKVEKGFLTENEML